MARRKTPKLEDLAYGGPGGTARIRKPLESPDRDELAPQLSDALVAAVCTRNRELVALLLEYGADPNASMDGRCPVLCRATWEAPSDPAVAAIVALLLDRGASLAARDEEGSTPFLSAVRHCAKQRPAAKARAARAWEEFAAAFGGEETPNASEAVGEVERVETESRGDPRPFPRFGVIDLLLERGASLTDRDPDGATAVLVAAAEDDDELVRTLIERGAPPDGLLEIELLRATREGRAEYVARLLTRGADPNRRIRSRTALGDAAEDGRLEVVDLLLAGGADPDLAESDSPTGDFRPLFRGAYSGHLDVVRRLLEAGADPRSLGPGRARVLDYAKLGQREGLAPDQPWDELIDLLRRSMSAGGAAPTLALKKVRGKQAVLAAIRSVVPELARVQWREARPGDLVLYESAPIGATPNWDALHAVAADHGFAPVLVGWSLDDLEPDARTGAEAIAAIDAGRGQETLDRLEAERRRGASEWEPEEDEVKADPWSVITSLEPLPAPRARSRIELALGRWRVAPVRAAAEAIYVLYGPDGGDPGRADLANVLARWRERTGAALAAIGTRSVHVVAPRPLTKVAAIRRQALDLYTVCPDLGVSPRHLLAMAASREWILSWD